jgi:hypothetical protein
MAHQSAVNADIGHEHCPECGACLIGGYTQKFHTCDARPVDMEVLAVMMEDMRATDEKSRSLHRIPDGFYEVGGLLT